MAASNEQTFSFDTVAVLLSASGIVVGSQHYKIMTALDNTKTASGYEHMFRKVKARAKEITEMREKGDFGVESPTPAKKGKAVDGGGKDGGSKKRGRAVKKEESADNGDGEVEEESLSKRAKKEEEEEGEGENVKEE